MTILEARGNTQLRIRSASILTPPTKTKYAPGEYFDPTGLVVSVTYTDGSTKSVSSFEYDETLYPAINANDTSVILSIYENDSRATVSQTINVPLAIPLHFVANTAGSTINLSGGGWGSYQYSTDNRNWQTYTQNTELTLTNVGDKVYLRGNCTSDRTNTPRFYMTGSIAAHGNIMSLYFNDDFATQKTLAKNQVAYNLFSGCTSLTTPPLLPATTLSQACYFGMFDNCSNLEYLPSLPATNLAHECYYYMFSNCSKIKLSTGAAAAYPYEYRIPISGAGTAGWVSVDGMFNGTGGSWTGTPSLNTIYYTANQISED